jgi:hypothetical protein
VLVWEDEELSEDDVDGVCGMMSVEKDWEDDAVGGRCGEDEGEDDTRESEARCRPGFVVEDDDTEDEGGIRVEEKRLYALWNGEAAEGGSTFGGDLRFALSRASPQLLAQLPPSLCLDISRSRSSSRYQETVFAPRMAPRRTASSSRNSSSFAPPPDVASYKDLLLFEERLKQNAALLRSRKRKYERQYPIMSFAQLSLECDDCRSSEKVDK